MKYYIWKSKTPILDSFVTVAYFCLFSFGLLDFSVTKIIEFWGLSSDLNFTGSSREIFALCTIFVFLIVFYIGAIVLARRIASKFFGVAAGDSRVELDIEKRESSIYTDGKLETRKKWDKTKNEEKF